jgi:hypothetical protein
MSGNGGNSSATPSSSRLFGSRTRPASYPGCLPKEKDIDYWLLSLDSEVRLIPVYKGSPAYTTALAYGTLVRSPSENVLPGKAERAKSEKDFWAEQRAQAFKRAEKASEKDFWASQRAEASKCADRARYVVLEMVPREISQGRLRRQLGAILLNVPAGRHGKENGLLRYSITPSAAGAGETTWILEYGCPLEANTAITQLRCAISRFCRKRLGSNVPEIQVHRLINGTAERQDWAMQHMKAAKAAAEAEAVKRSNTPERVDSAAGPSSQDTAVRGRFTAVKNGCASEADTARADAWAREVKEGGIRGKWNDEAVWWKETPGACLWRSQEILATPMRSGRRTGMRGLFNLM